MKSLLKIILISFSLLLGNKAVARCENNELIHQAIVSQSIFRLGGNLVLEHTENNSKSFGISLSDYNILNSKIPDSLVEQYSKELIVRFDNYTKSGAGFSKYSFKSNGDNELNIYLNISPIAYSNNSNLALVYFEVIDEKNIGSGIYSLYYKNESIWFEICQAYSWTS